MALTTPEVVHGKVYSYRDLGCRCDDCRQAHNKACREANARKRAAYIYDPEDDHGTVRVYQRGCPCDICREVHSRVTRDFKERSEKSKQGVCEICGDSTKVVWDHDHNTGAHRGWLCRQCNLGLGSFRDDILLLRRVMEYLS